ncbi:MAG: hypothetical protein WA977_04915 [Halobacteriota archaeon]
MEKTRKAEENAKRIRSFLTSPVKLSATFIIMVFGINMYLMYVLGHHPLVPFPLSNRLLVAMLNGVIWYCLVLFGAWIAMKAWESKAKKERKEFLKLKTTTVAKLFLAAALVFLVSSYMLSDAFIPGIAVVLCIAGALLIISIIAKDTHVLVRDRIERELLAERIEEPLKRLKFLFIGIALVICVDLVYTYSFNLSAPLSSYPPAIIITKIFLDMSIFAGCITLAIVIGLKLLLWDVIID